MGDMSASDFMVEEINHAPRVKFVVGAIDGMESSLHKVVIIVRKMRNVDISVLKPVAQLELLVRRWIP